MFEEQRKASPVIKIISKFMMKLIIKHKNAKIHNGRDYNFLRFYMCLPVY